MSAEPIRVRFPALADAPASATEPVPAAKLSTRELRTWYGDFLALRDVSIAAPRSQRCLQAGAGAALTTRAGQAR